jgi:hypothetical protein
VIGKKLKRTNLSYNQKIFLEKRLSIRQPHTYMGDSLYLVYPYMLQADHMISFVFERFFEMIESQTYTISEVAVITGKSKNLIYRRLTEKNSKYTVRFVRKEGDRWVFNRKMVDDAVGNGESVVVKKQVDKPKIEDYFDTNGQVPCQKELAHG